MENISHEINLNQLSRNASDEALQFHPTELVALIIQIIITTTACPFTILLNILVISAVKKTPHLQSKPNILLACLAATDAFIGLTAQPSSILVEVFRLIDMKSLAVKIQQYFHNGALLAGIINSLLHLMLVTFERLVAIKFTTQYPFVITEKYIKISVAIFWIVALCSWALMYTAPFIAKVIGGPLVPSCVIFITISYVILYRETLRHKKRIKTEQIPQQEVEIFLRQNKALKTTVYVVGSLVLCFMPSYSLFLSVAVEWLTLKNSIYFVSFCRVIIMLNSLLNPLIYFWRDKEMRRLVLPSFPRCVRVNPSN
ncbi:lysophosphatidic acid receptor 3-like [Acropora millepora]|uniref:lysophosphatidic acid receptor 3-like n=1 Tax=Acropora millepora TaxID=45264 RepID=UPI001CF3515D|nr:lysophosphatidic acid receptor 3-like [Acropora millepora]